MTCLNEVCTASEYQAINVKVEASKLFPGGPSSCADDKDVAESLAIDELEAAVKAQGEHKDCPAGCDCDKIPFSDWKTIDTGLRSTRIVKTVQTDGSECKWLVVLTYDRQFRDGSAKCHVKPLAMLSELEASELVASLSPDLLESSSEAKPHRRVGRG